MRDAGVTIAPHRLKLPWGFLLAIAILIPVEIAVRMMPLNVTVPYARRNDALEAVTLYADAGSTDIVTLGSSMMREAISPLAIRGQLEYRGAHTTVGNFAVRGGRPDEVRLTTQRLLAGPRKPKIAIIGVSLIDLVDTPVDYDRLASYWRLGDWWAAYRRARADQGKRHEGPLAPDPHPPRKPAEPVKTRAKIIQPTADVPAAVRTRWSRAVYNQCASLCYILRCRDRLRELLLHPSEVVTKISEDPVLGTPGRPRESRIAQGLVTPKAVRRYLDRILPGGRFDFGRNMTGETRDTLAQYRAAGVRTYILEMPLSSVMRSCIAPERIEKFRAICRTLAAESGATFLAVDDIKFDQRDEWFYDAQHLNHGGCRQFSVALTENCILPALGLPAGPATQPAESPTTRPVRRVKRR
jgi:hypothetical protein